MSGGAEPTTRLAVVGAGAWGTVLACLLAQRAELHVTLWARRPELAQELREARENRAYAPGLALPEPLRVTADLEGAVAGAAAVFLAVPSRGLRAVLAALPPVPAVVSCAKGLEYLEYTEYSEYGGGGAFRRFTEVIAEAQPRAQLAALSGPNLAAEIAAGLPASATVAAQDAALARRAQGWLSSPTFRVYTSADVIGAEVGGAVKNVIALAAGMCDGLGLGDNAKASIITRGLAEVVRLGVHLGGQEKTFYGLSGLGDMIATCSSPGSRNHAAGVRLALGETLEDLEASRLTAEGLPTVRAVVAYAARAKLDLPIASAVYSVVFGGKAPQQALNALMARGSKAEW